MKSFVLLDSWFGEKLQRRLWNLRRASFVLLTPFKFYNFIIRNHLMLLLGLELFVDTWNCGRRRARQTNKRIEIKIKLSTFENSWDKRQDKERKRIKKTTTISKTLEIFIAFKPLNSEMCATVQEAKHERLKRCRKFVSCQNSEHFKEREREREMGWGGGGGGRESKRLPWTWSKCRVDFKSENLFLRWKKRWILWKLKKICNSSTLKGFFCSKSSWISSTSSSKFEKLSLELERKALKREKLRFLY